MPRRPYRQAIPLHEVRARQTRRKKALLWRRNGAVIGGGLAVIVAAVILFIGFTGGGRIRARDTDPTPNLANVAKSTPGVGSGRATPPPVAPTDDPIGDPGLGGTPAPRTPKPDPTPEPAAGSPESLTGYQWPIRNGLIYAFFAPRDSGFLVVDGDRIHEGIDVATFCGDTIRAAHDGVVKATGRDFDREMGFKTSLDAFYANANVGALPIVVVIDDGNGYRSVYVHLSKTAVKKGDRVKAGDVIGYEGATGNASGCHLHYEMFRTDGPWMKVAPQLVRQNHYPAFERERVDPFRVLSMDMPGHPGFILGINPPKVSPGLGRPTVTKPD